MPLSSLGPILNTALISSRTPAARNWMSDIEQIMRTPAYAALLGAVQALAAGQGISESSAAENLIETVRSLDSVWRDYVFQEGLERLRNP